MAPRDRRRRPSGSGTPSWRRVDVRAAVRRVGLALVPFFAYFALWLAVTWPVALHPSTDHVQTRFGSSHLWIFEVLRSGWDGRIPLWLWERGYPAGGATIFIGLPALPVYAAFRTVVGPLAAMNFTLPAMAAFAGWSTWALARHLGLSQAASAFAGLGYTLNGYVLSIAFIGELPNLCHGFLPLAVLAIDACATSWLAPLLGAAAWSALLLSTPYYGILSSWFLVGCAGLVALRSRTPGTWLRLALLAALAAVPSYAITSYFQILRELSPSYQLLRPATAAIGVHGERDTWLFMEATLDGLLKAGKIPLAAAMANAIQVAYLGWVPVGFALLAWLRRPRAAVLAWWVAGLCAVVLMLGDVLIVGSRPYQTAGGDVLLLPLGWAKAQFPVLKLFAVPYRAAVVATLCLAVLGGYAVDAWPRARGWLAAVGGAAWIAETLAASPTPWPFPVVHDPVAAPYRGMGEDPTDYAVLPFPFECVPGQGIGRFQRYFYDATVHRKRVPWADRFVTDRGTDALGARQIVSEPFVVGLCGLLGVPPAPPPAGSGDTAWLASVGLRYVTLHLDLLDPGQVEPVRAYLLERLGPPGPLSGDGVEVYTVGDGTITPSMLGRAPPQLRFPWPSALYEATP